jgi:zinc transport system substrate-binding protein
MKTVTLIRKGEGKRKVGKLTWIFVMFLLILTGCSSEAPQKNGENSPRKLEIVTTFYPMYYFTKQVVGNTANVTQLIPNGVEPHDWEPTARDMAKMQDADVFIYNSRYFETWKEKVFQSIDTSHLKVVEAASKIKLMDANGQEMENGPGASKDPHVWLSPVLAQQEVDQIASALKQKDPKHSTQYEKNAEAFKAKLNNLDQLFKETINKAPRKEFVTQHAAFGYLARQYGLKQIAIAGLSPDVEPTLGKLAELAKLTKKKHIDIIYFEGLTSSKVASTLANEIGAKTEVLNPLEGLTADDKKHSLDYLGVMKKNLKALKKTLYQINN